MVPEDFDKLLDILLDHIKTVLKSKESEYSEGVDRFDQFKKGSIYLGRPPHQVLAGMMIKHTTSIYDMLKKDSTTVFPVGKWEEKIFDHIIYLLLLMGIVEENNGMKLEK